MDLETTPRHRPLTRRRLLCGAATAALGLLAAACGGTTDTPTPAPPAPPTATTLASAPTPSVVPAAAATVPGSPTPLATPATTPRPAATAARASTVAAAATPAPTAPLLVFVGDSITYGTGATPGNTYPQQTLARLQPTAYDSKVVAAGGRPIAFTREFAPTMIDPEYAPSRSKNIVVLQTSLTRDGVVEKDYADTVAFCTERRAVGWRVVVLTLLPATGQYSYPAYEADRGPTNDKLRANWRGFADALADIAAVPELGNAEAVNDPRYFNKDGTHPTDAGYALMADVVAAAIRTL